MKMIFCGAIALALASCHTAEKENPSSSDFHSKHQANASHGMSLDELDKRIPLPLSPQMAQHQKENMRHHLEVIRDIAKAMAVSDFNTAAKAAKTMGASPQTATMCEHMGAGAPGFTELAMKMHESADKIALAAEQKNAKGVWQKVGETLVLCTGCHSTYKQQITP